MVLCHDDGDDDDDDDDEDDDHDHAAFMMRCSMRKPLGKIIEIAMRAAISKYR